MILSVLFSKYRTKPSVKDRHTDIQTNASEHTRHTHKHNHTYTYTPKTQTQGQTYKTAFRQAQIHSFNRQRTENTEIMIREFKFGLCSRLNDPKEKEMLFSP